MKDNNGGFSDNLINMQPDAWNGYMTFGLLLNSKDQTTFEKSSCFYPVFEPAERLDSDISILLNHLIHHTASNDVGFLKFKDAESKCCRHMIRIRTYYEFKTWKRGFRKGIYELFDRYMREIGRLVNEILKEYEIYLPAGKADFTVRYILPAPEGLDERVDGKEEDGKEEKALGGESRKKRMAAEAGFWLPIDRKAPKKDVKWYLLQAVNGVYLEGAEAELGFMRYEDPIVKEYKDIFYGGDGT